MSQQVLKINSSYTWYKVQIILYTNSAKETGSIKLIKIYYKSSLLAPTCLCKDESQVALQNFLANRLRAHRPLPSLSLCVGIPSSILESMNAHLSLLEASGLYDTWLISLLYLSLAGSGLSPPTAAQKNFMWVNRPAKHNSHWETQAYHGQSTHTLLNLVLLCFLFM